MNLFVILGIYMVISIIILSVTFIIKKGYMFHLNSINKNRVLMSMIIISTILYFIQVFFLLLTDIDNNAFLLTSISSENYKDLMKIILKIIVGLFLLGFLLINYSFKDGFEYLQKKGMILSSSMLVIYLIISIVKYIFESINNSFSNILDNKECSKIKNKNDCKEPCEWKEKENRCDKPQDGSPGWKILLLCLIYILFIYDYFSLFTCFKKHISNTPNVINKDYDYLLLGILSLIIGFILYILRDTTNNFNWEDNINFLYFYLFIIFLYTIGCSYFYNKTGQKDTFKLISIALYIILSIGLFLLPSIDYITYIGVGIQFVCTIVFWLLVVSGHIGIINHSDIADTVSKLIFHIKSYSNIFNNLNNYFNSIFDILGNVILVGIILIIFNKII